MSLFKLNGVRPSNSGQHLRAKLRRSSEGGAVHVVQPELCVVSQNPFEIVQQCPMNIPDNRDTIGDRQM
jgi:hypothetical protein